jgi:ribosomal protein L37E
LSDEEDYEEYEGEYDGEAERETYAGPPQDEYYGTDYGRTSSRSSPPKLRKCKRCGTEFFEIRWRETCPRCGGAVTKVSSSQPG